MLMDVLLSYKAAIVLIWFALIFAAERYFRAASYPAQSTPKTRLQRIVSNLSISAINVLLSPLMILPLTAWISLHFSSWRPEWLQGPWVFLLDLLILDCFLYWWHRFSHRMPWLWRFHEVHHLDEFLDSTTALRFHFGEVFISAIVRVCFILVFAIPFTSVVIFEIILLVCTIFNHSNLKLPPRLESLLSHIIVTPSIHWVHHHALQQDTDSNYATIFSFWDKVFGTRNSKLRWHNMSIGVEGRRELSLLRLILRPLRA